MAYLNAIIVISVIVLSFSNYVLSAPSPNSLIKTADNSSMLNSIMDMVFTSVDAIKSEVFGGEAISRSKRQASSGAGKFTDAARSPQIKVFRTFLQTITNSFSKDPIGGTGPFDPVAIKPVIKMYKHRIVDYFFPPVGDSKVK